MSTIDRAELHKVVDELTDEQVIELKKLLQPFIEKKAQQGSPWAKELYDLFAPMRQNAVESGMTSEEIDQLLDEELTDVRHKRSP